MRRGRLYGGLLLSLCACDAGPISDFPFRAPGSGDGQSPANGADAAAPSLPPPVATTPDGGLSGWPPENSGDSGGPPSDADDDAGTDVGPGDGGPDDGGTDADSEAPPPDGPWACPTSGAVDECAGPFCGLTRAELSQASVAGACADDPASLSASCSGELSLKVAQCAQSTLAAGDLPSSDVIVTCLGQSLARVADSTCVTCFADEASCALRRCGGAFLTGDEQLAAACRSLLCGPTFSACSGLPSGAP